LPHAKSQNPRAHTSLRLDIGRFIDRNGAPETCLVLPDEALLLPGHALLQESESCLL
jgi:hypothetical protein